VLLALPGSAVVDFVRDHKQELDGKILIDATNNLRGSSIHSWSELSEKLPGAHLYRAFNTLGWEMFAEPVVGGEQADLFYAGPEGPAAATVERLIGDVGLRPIRVGGPDQADVVDGALRLWIALTRSRGRRIAFKLISD
jgi:8-hydroxy-5-deazaflavin:NADPH oxidoreductase